MLVMTRMTVLLIVQREYFERERKHCSSLHWHNSLNWHCSRKTETHPSYSPWRSIISLPGRSIISLPDTLPFSSECHWSRSQIILEIRWPRYKQINLPKWLKVNNEVDCILLSFSWVIPLAFYSRKTFGIGSIY